VLTHVVWDWNGTLLDDVDAAVEAMNGLLLDKGLPLLDRARYRRVYGFPARNYLERLGLGPEHGSFDEIARVYLREYDRRARDVPVRPRGRELLARLQRRGLRQILLSAARASHVRELVARHRLGEYFDEILGIEDLRAGGKLEVARRWLEESWLDPSGMLLIGDTDHDHEVATAIGAGCVLVAGGHQEEVRLRACGCPVLSALAEFDWADTPLRPLLAGVTTAPLDSAG
jgi:phosphoglycolate phosphatase